MAESSITHNFIFRGTEAAERLAKILEESANDPPRPSTVNVKFLEDPAEIRECMEKIERTIAQRRPAAQASKPPAELSARWAGQASSTR